jgi:hypothetical protein
MRYTFTERKDEAVELSSQTLDLAAMVPQELLEQGLLGRGCIVGVQQTPVSIGLDFDPSHVCVFTVDVALDNVARYATTCRQAVRASMLPRLMTPGATIAVRVDRDDHDRIALSLCEEPPAVQTPCSADLQVGSGDLLEPSVPCQVVIVHTQPLGMRNPHGDDMYAFTLTVLADGQPPHQIEIGNPVPAAARPLLYPGSTVPAKLIRGGDDRELVIDWEGALARQATTAA